VGVAITIRIVLVENLRRVAEAIVRGRAARQEADALADDVLGLRGGPADPASIGLQWFGDAPLVTAFAVQLVQRLRDQDPAVTPALLWLDQRLAAQGTTADDIVRVEHQRQAATNVTVRNVILSMTLMSSLDWAELFESVSLVEGVLGATPSYGAMDFTTRDGYRHAIEELARGRVGPSWTSLGRRRSTRNAPGRGKRAGRTTPATTTSATTSSATGARPSSSRSASAVPRCDGGCALSSGRRLPRISERSPCSPDASSRFSSSGPRPRASARRSCSCSGVWRSFPPPTW